ncbi:MAG: type II secretion system F family protein [Candidatus Dadabacteria bacterium]|nr:MAG: type II secretion system F family protein [Candidatus Dadabacteria bacterium]
MSGLLLVALICWACGWLVLTLGPVVPPRFAHPAHIHGEARTLRFLLALAAPLRPQLDRSRAGAAVAGRLRPLVEELDTPWGASAADWCAAGLVLAGLLGGIAWLAGGGPVVVTLAAATGAAMPLLVLRDLRNERRRMILRGFPDLLDAQALLLRAGLDPLHALERFAQARDGADPLRQELDRLLGLLRSGVRLTDALAHFEARLALDELRGVMAAWRQGIESGAPLAELFARNAAELRHRRFERAEQAAAQAAIRLAGPLLMIFGAVLLIVLGPLILQLGGLF